MHQNILIPLEDNYKITFTFRQIRFWVKFFTDGTWTRPQIVATKARVLTECHFPPTASDWAKHRVRTPEPSYAPTDEPIGATCNRLTANLDPDSWEAFLMRETARGLSKRGKERGGMREAYRRIIAEGEKRGMPEHVDHAVLTGPPKARNVAYTMDVGLNAFRQALAGMEER